MAMGWAAADLCSLALAVRRCPQRNHIAPSAARGFSPLLCISLGGQIRRSVAECEPLLDSVRPYIVALRAPRATQVR
jgi:hypothetical protein